MNPYYYHLAQDDWDVFGSLSFNDSFFPALDKGDMAAGGIRRKKCAFMFLRKIMDDDRTRWNRAQWVLRHEVGELEGRPHYHFLVRNLNRPNIFKRKIKKNKSYKTGKSYYCYLLQKYWQNKTDSLADIRPYKKWVDGAVKYAVKDANRYETGKFGTAIEVEFSHAYEARLIDRNNYNTEPQQELYPSSEAIA